MTLAEGVEYENAFSNILIEDSTSLNSRGVGIFVDGYVTGVTLRNLHVEGSGSTGIYLEAGSKDNVVEDCDIVDNGYTENGPDGQVFAFGGIDIWFWGTGREGLAIDGSRFNQVRNNRFSGNSAGGIFLYKNCGEFVNQRPGNWWHRRYGADGNLIEGNTFTGEDVGVWIGSRMGENTLPMDCSDPAYVEGGLDRVVLDYAADNVVQDNAFDGVTYGVRVEDDRAVVADNTFTGTDPAQQAIIVGTRFRTPVLGQPVDGTTITGNRATITGSKNPYRWIHGHTATTFADNQSFGRPVGFCEGVQPPTNQFIFVVAFELYDPDVPPSPPPVIPPPLAPPPCPTDCAATAPASDPRIVMRRLGTPLGDDTLAIKGRITVAHPFAPPLDPVTTGVAVVVTNAGGTRIVDVVVPGGAYDPVARSGWKASAGRGLWTYTNRTAGETGGVKRVAVKDLSRKTPGLVQFSVKMKGGAYAIAPADLPLEALVALDPPTAETGQCGQATFVPPSAACTLGAGTLRCR
jgi:parallel beta-helix repeat protein